MAITDKQEKSIKRHLSDERFYENLLALIDMEIEGKNRRLCDDGIGYLVGLVKRDAAVLALGSLKEQLEVYRKEAVDEGLLMADQTIGPSV